MLNNKRIIIILIAIVSASACKKVELYKNETITKDNIVGIWYCKADEQDYHFYNDARYSFYTGKFAGARANGTFKVINGQVITHTDSFIIPSSGAFWYPSNSTDTLSIDQLDTQHLTMYDPPWYYFYEKQ